MDAEDPRLPALPPKNSQLKIKVLPPNPGPQQEQSPPQALLSTCLPFLHRQQNPQAGIPAPRPARALPPRLTMPPTYPVREQGGGTEQKVSGLSKV